MAAFTNKIETVDMSGLSDFERIDQNLRTLIVAIAETLPGSRGFGLSIEVFDLLPNETRNQFAAELDEKVAEFIPEIRIADIDFEMDGGTVSGTASVRIYVEANSEYEEVDEE